MGHESSVARRTTHDSRLVLLVASSCATLLALACTLPPLRDKAEVGTDPYAVVVADGSGGSDLYAVVGTGNEVVPLTFSPVREAAPSLSPDGSMVAFVRLPLDGTDGQPSVWVINLLSGAERELPMPDSADQAVRRVAWSPDGRTVYAETGRALWQWPAPPQSPAAEPVPAGQRPTADSALATVLGTPPFAIVTPCDSGGPALCADTREGTVVLARGATAPARWGADSVAWIQQGEIVVRPLGGGASRVIDLASPASNPTALSYFPGTNR